MIIITNSELIEIVSNKAKSDNNIFKWQTEYIIELYIKCLINELKNGNDIKIFNLGSFKHYKRKSYVGRDINSNENITIPESFYISFKPSKNIKTK